MNSKISPELAHKYINEKCSDEEIDILYRWYESMEANADPSEILSIEEKAVLKELMLNKIKNNIFPVEHAAETKSNSVLRYLIYTVSGIAALLLLIWGNSFYKDYLPAKAGIKVVVSNMTNELHKEILSDGTIVWLNPKSSLEYPENFTGELREVKMKGEAFFEVTKDHAHPFVIYSGGVVTRVWGTSFRIRTNGELQTEVSVVTGKVSVKIPRKKDSEVMLLPDQKVTYLKSTELLTKEQEKPTSTMGIWKKTNLSFDNMPLSEVILVLNKKFGYEIATEDETLKKYLLKADFNNESLPEILELLEKSLNINYKINDRQIIFIRKQESQN
jgi:transmembrane sensor